MSKVKSRTFTPSRGSDTGSLLECVQAILFPRPELQAPGFEPVLDCPQQLAEHLRAMPPTAAALPRIVEAEDLEAAVELCYREGWTDGLAVIPATAEPVQRIIDYL